MRRGLVMAAVSATMIVAAGPADAGGGGGCFAPVTEASGNSVLMRRYCFRPTILHVRPGDAVTFQNRDDAAHVVNGANYSFGKYRDYDLGDIRTFRFDESGVYPYVCYYHPGMSGAIVVGDVDRPGITVPRTIDRIGVQLLGDAPEPAPRIVRIVRPQAPAPTSSPWKAVAVASGGLLVLVVIGAAGFRRRNRERTA
jgi:plastocyanin